MKRYEYIEVEINGRKHRLTKEQAEQVDEYHRTGFFKDKFGRTFSL